MVNVKAVNLAEIAKYMVNALHFAKNKAGHAQDVESEDSRETPSLVVLP